MSAHENRRLRVRPVHGIDCGMRRRAGRLRRRADLPCCQAHPRASETVVWKGPCKDGYASGPGVLARNQQGILRDTMRARYEVTMVQGHISGMPKPGLSRFMVRMPKPGLSRFMVRGRLRLRARGAGTQPARHSRRHHESQVRGDHGAGPYQRYAKTGSVPVYGPIYGLLALIAVKPGQTQFMQNQNRVKPKPGLSRFMPMVYMH
jgi:hypothetical protein